jgi:Fe-S cluster biosynthesis and repair protein YggX
MSRFIECAKLGKQAEGLENAPMPGEIGKKIYDQISKQAWQMWIAHQTMLINEYRLSMRDAKSRAFLLEEMDKFLFGAGSEKPAGFVPQSII